MPNSPSKKSVLSTNREFKKEFLKALRGGHYKQTIGAMRVGEECFCAAGVGIDVAIKMKLDGFEDLHWVRHDLFGSCHLVKGAFGQRTSVSVSGTWRALFGETGSGIISRNDSGRWSFLEIADWISAKR